VTAPWIRSIAGTVRARREGRNPAVAVVSVLCLGLFLLAISRIFWVRTVRVERCVELASRQLKLSREFLALARHTKGRPGSERDPFLSLIAEFKGWARSGAYGGR
jgi:hypothetical protein